MPLWDGNDLLSFSFNGVYKPTQQVMPRPTNLSLPDDEHYYFGVELRHSPEEVKERWLRNELVVSVAQQCGVGRAEISITSGIRG